MSREQPPPGWRIVNPDWPSGEGPHLERVDDDDVTPRQAEALAWLDTVGKATPKTLKRHGFQDRTLRALWERGLIDRELRRTPQGGFAVYRPKDKQ